MDSIITFINNNQTSVKFMLSILYGMIALIINKFAKQGFKKLKDLNPDENSVEDLIPFLGNIAKFGIILALIYSLLELWELDVTPLLASAGVAGIAIAYAAKDTVSNLFGGISVFIDKPFKIGDYILIDGLDKRGTIYKIGARSTKILTSENILVTIPNSLIVTNPIYNETGYDPKMNVKIPVGVAYGSDLDKVENVILDVLKKDPNIFKEPEPLVLFTGFGDSSINLLAIGTISDPSQKGIATHGLIKSIYKALNSKNIEIPFPQRDIHIHTEEQ